MGEFFKPWRRKLGVMTLMLACVFTAGWVRTFFYTDFYWCPIGVHSMGRLTSYRGGLIVIVIPDAYTTLLKWEQHPASTDVDFAWIKTEPDLPLDGQCDWSTHHYGLGFGFSRSSPELGSQSVRFFPYWSIVIPLTAISAYLLLSKPRKATQSKTTKPIQDGEGAAS